METEEISLFPFFYAPNSQCTISCLRNELWALDRHYKKTIQGNLFFKNPRSFGIRAKLQIVGCKLVWVDLILKNHLMLWFGPFYVLNQRSKIFFCPLCLKLCFSNLCPPSVLFIRVFFRFWCANWKTNKVRMDTNQRNLQPSS